MESRNLDKIAKPVFLIGYFTKIKNFSYLLVIAKFFKGGLVELLNLFLL